MLTALLALLVVAQDPQTPRFAGYPEQDAISYELELAVDPVREHLAGTVTYRFRAVEALEQIRLDSTPGEAWQIVFRDASGRVMRAERKGGQLVVELPRRVAAGDDVVFTAELSGTPPDGFYFTQSRYGDPLGFTDHYSIRARGWLPCEDHPGDRAVFRTTLTYPDGNTALASGRMSDEEAGPDGRRRLTSETVSDIPPYMYAIVVGPYARVPEAGDPRLVPHFVYRPDVDIARDGLVHHAEWIKILEENIGPYVYGKYTVVQCPTRWGGFEAPSNTQLTERIFDRGDRGVGTMAHELVHMWFGDSIGYAEWREVWLSEGFASYFGPWVNSQTGGTSFAASLDSMRERWRRSEEGRTKSVRWDGFEHPDNALNSNTYPNGAWVRHMLRGELGEEGFFGAIRDFYGEHKGTSVMTTDFVASIEKSSDRELGWFFDQWLNWVGCPELRVVPRGGIVVVEQVQDGPPYRFRLPLQWVDGNGDTVKRFFEIRDRRTEIGIGAGDLKSLTVDPDLELLYRESR